jgi:hypothetical protein
MRPILVVLFLACELAAQQRSGTPPPSPQRMEVTLERQEGGAFKPVDPGFVFEKGDRLRFRFRANFDGYL